jgi:hypothetical protein
VAQVLKSHLEQKTEEKRSAPSTPHASVPTFAIGSGGVILLVIDDYNFVRRQRYKAKTTWQCHTKV